MRVGSHSSVAEEGNVRIVRDSWNRNFIGEFELFPYGDNEGIVDRSSGAFSKLAERVPPSGTTVQSLWK